MSIITLTTDFGVKDHYNPVLKAIIQTACAQAHIIDLSQNINKHDIVQSAFLMKSTCPHYSRGSIHVNCVHLYQKPNPRLIIARHRDQFYIGPDNGVFSLIFDLRKNIMYSYPIDLNSRYPFFNSIADICAKLIEGWPLNEIGTLCHDATEILPLRPVLTQNEIRASIFYIDDFGNVMANITRDIFEEVRNGRPFLIYFKHDNPIREISKTYSDVPIGDVVCLFNSLGYLEIAINMGNAQKDLLLNTDEAIQINFL